LSKSNWLLVLIVGSLALLLVLISALPGLELKPNVSGYVIPAIVDDLAGDFLHLYPCLIFTVVVCTLGALYFLRGRATATLLMGMAFLALIFLLFFWIYSDEQALPTTTPVVTAPEPFATREMESEEPLPEEEVWEEVDPFTPPSPWVILAASFGVALMLVTLMASVSWYLWLSRRPVAPPTGALAEELAREAQSAVDALRSGAAFQDVVIRCYWDMSQVLSESRGIERKEVMTSGEFESYLVAMGLPQEPVSSLTRLFEEVRYGTKQPDSEEGERAIASLTAIIQACEGRS
jgi:hypothetical protein